MGNHIEGEKYCFQDQFVIIDRKNEKEGLCRLQRKDNKQTLIGKELDANNEEDRFQIQYIISQKINNPSPFICKMLKSRILHKQSYCSYLTHFYLLFEEPSRTLFSEIQQRRANNKVFLPQQIDSVITRVAKGLKYLYDINHHHLKISTHAISWPKRQEQNIKLIDQWALESCYEVQQVNYYKPKNSTAKEQKNLHLATDLYYLGVVAGQMKKVGNYLQQSLNLSMKGMIQDLQVKILTLASTDPNQRLKIYEKIVEKVHFPGIQPLFVNKEQIYNKNQPLKLQSYPNFELNKVENKGFFLRDSNIKQKNAGFQSINNFVPSSNFYNIGVDTKTNQKMNFSLEKTAIPEIQRKQVNSILHTTGASSTYKMPTMNSSSQKFHSTSYKLGTASTIGTTNINFNNNNFTFNNITNKHLQNPLSSFKSTFNSSSLQFSSSNSNIIQSKKLQSQFSSFSSSKFNDMSYKLGYTTHTNAGIGSSKINFTNNLIADPDNKYIQNSYSVKNTFPSVFQQQSQKFATKTIAITNFSHPSQPEASIKSYQYKNINPGKGLFQSSQYKIYENIEDRPISLSTELNQLIRQAEKQPALYSYQKEKLVSQDIIKQDKLSPQKNQDKNIKIEEQQDQNERSLDRYDMIVRNDMENVKYGEIYQEEKKQQIEHQEDSDKKNVFTIAEASQSNSIKSNDAEQQYVIEEYENGSRYEGHKRNGMRYGSGKFYYQEGSLYNGQWKQNNMHGQGKLYYGSGKLAYQGSWFNDQFHGLGKVYNDFPSQIEGSFNYYDFDDLQECWMHYQGSLISDSKEGKGILYLSNDQFYEGEFKNDKMNGKGKFTTIKGETIQGIWKDNKLLQIL